MTCPLCTLKDHFTVLQGPDENDYYCCQNCKLIFLGEKNLPSPIEEKDRYLEHNNGIEYPGYVKFLNQAVEPALKYLKPGMSGLDYGCGPGPTLHILLERQGLDCKIYDPFFYPELPPGLFVFIFSTETFEHFFSPREEIIRIKEKIYPGGVLIIMTQKWESKEIFPKWYYAKDPTHVCFYHEQSFTYISDEFGFLKRESGNSRVIILQKK